MTGPRSSRADVAALSASGAATHSRRTPERFASLVLVAIAQLADLVTFYAATSVLPLAYEQNPLARAGFATVAKLGYLFVALFVIDRWLWRRPAWLRVGFVATVVGLGLAGAAANVAVLAAVFRWPVAA